MFLHLSNLKKQMKKAYTDGKLDIGNINDGLLISNGHFMIWIDNNYISNTVKSLVVLFAGIMPKKNELFTVSKHEKDPQYKLSDTYNKALFRGNLMDKLITIPITLNENYEIKLMQGPDRVIYGVNLEYLTLVDIEACDFDAGENAPTGPCFSGDITDGIYWYNGIGTVMIMPLKPKKFEIPEILSLLKFNQDGSISGEVLENFHARLMEKTEDGKIVLQMPLQEADQNEDEDNE